MPLEPEVAPSNDQGVALVTRRGPWRPFWEGVSTNSGAFDALTANLSLAGAPETSKTSGRFVHLLQPCSHAKLGFYAQGSDGDDFTARVSGARPVLAGQTLVGWVMDPLYALNLTVGATAMSRAFAKNLGILDASNADLGAADALWVDTISVGTDYSYSSFTAKIGPATAVDTRATFLFDALGYPALVVDLTSNGASSAPTGVGGLIVTI
jgi:hypothetical protein